MKPILFNREEHHEKGGFEFIMSSADSGQLLAHAIIKTTCDDYAKAEVDEIVGRQKNRMMNVVNRAWAEGKKAAEIEGISEIVKAALEQREGGQR